MMSHMESAGPSGSPSPGRRAFITGITGQDGSYLAEFLLGIGYEVHGLVRRAVDGTERDGLRLHHGDVTDAGRLHDLLAAVRPDEVYHLAAQSHVQVSFTNPVQTATAGAIGTLVLLEALRDLRRPVRLFHAASSEMFGAARCSPQDETTPFHPRSPYGCAKAHAYWQAVNHREAYGMHVSNGILFNHESPRRHPGFVTRKITRAAARIRLGLQDELVLGNLDARRDWGFAGDYVVAMWQMLQQPEPDDYVVATGKSWSVREFARAAFARLDLDFARYVRSDDALRRPAEVDALCGDASKARDRLGWQPAVGIEALVAMMVDADLALARRAPSTASPVARGRAGGHAGYREQADGSLP